jgi:Domain of unknown function (DUF3850)
MNMQTTEHELKMWPEYFEPTFVGLKRFDLRKNDRGFKVGDTVKLREWKPNGIAEQQHGAQLGDGEYTGRELVQRICYMIEGLGGSDTGIVPPLRGLERGFCILGYMETARS